MLVGKKFESRFYKELESLGIYWYSFYDYPGKVEGNNLRFMAKNPYDVFYYYCGMLYCIELKTTGGGLFSIGRNKMIKPHQVSSLHKAHMRGCRAGFLLESREKGFIWFVKIEDFLNFVEVSGKCSINWYDISVIGFCLGKSIKGIVDSISNSY